MARQAARRRAEPSRSAGIDQGHDAYLGHRPRRQRLRQHAERRDGSRAPSILGKTGIAMSVRGESFWLDKTRAAQLRPRSRPRYTLTPTIVLRNGQPFMAIGTPGGDNQEQTILQAFLNVVEFWPDWYPNLHDAFEWPRVQTLHFYGSFWPHRRASTSSMSNPTFRRRSSRS